MENNKIATEAACVCISVALVLRCGVCRWIRPILGICRTNVASTIEDGSDSLGIPVVGLFLMSAHES